jgi:hypothetical protein
MLARGHGEVIFSSYCDGSCNRDVHVMWRLGWRHVFWWWNAIVTLFVYFTTTSTPCIPKLFMSCIYLLPCHFPSLGIELESQTHVSLFVANILEFWVPIPISTYICKWQF